MRECANLFAWQFDCRLKLPREFAKLDGLPSTHLNRIVFVGDLVANSVQLARPFRLRIRKYPFPYGSIDEFPHGLKGDTAPCISMQNSRKPAPKRGLETRGGRKNRRWRVNRRNLSHSSRMFLEGL